MITPFNNDLNKNELKALVDSMAGELASGFYVLALRDIIYYRV
jgi:hypothetical protein